MNKIIKNTDRQYEDGLILGTDLVPFFQSLNLSESSGVKVSMIEQSGWIKFPPRLPEQPIFYPVMNEAYAIQIARDWNVPATGSGFVTRFNIKSDFIKNYKIQNVGGKIHNELWVPAEDLEEFNQNIVGKIELIRKYYAITNKK